MLPDWFTAIGTDRYLAAAEVPQDTASIGAVWNAWRVYTDEFDGFCETTLDPQFNRLSHPAQWTGSFAPSEDASVIVFGTGPSARPGLPGLIRQRHRLWIFTSPRGAELLAQHGVRPDLVLVEHRSPLDAHHTARHLDGAAAAALREAPLVAADWRTPSRVLESIPADRLFVPDPLPTWGLWPATAVALAMHAGAARIGLLGIDLGSAQAPDPAYSPLLTLLGLLARTTSAATIDCGPGGALKPRWLRGTVDALAGSPLAPPELLRRPAATPAARHRDAVATLATLEPNLAIVRDALADGLACRARREVAVARLEQHVSDLLSWSADERVRLAIQEGLGCSFLPRLWRGGIDPALGRALWRPLVLAAHEIVGQADSLRRITGAGTALADAMKVAS